MSVYCAKKDLATKIIKRILTSKMQHRFIDKKTKHIRAPIKLKKIM